MSTTQPTTDDLSENCIRLRDVADADDARCPDEIAGCLIVSYDSTLNLNASYTEGRAVSARLPTWCLVFFEDGCIDVSDLDVSTRAVIRKASAVYGNEIDFAGTKTVDA